MAVRQFGQRRHIGHLAQGIRRRFQKQHFGVGADGGGPFGGVGLRHKADVDAEAADVAANQPGGSAKQAAAGNQMVARA